MSLPRTAARLLAVALAWTLARDPAAVCAALPAPSLVRIRLQPDAPTHPIEVPVEPGDSVELDLPGGILDWAGRGFTPDPERYAGDFEIEAVRGERRVFVTALSSGERRILHLVIAGPGQAGRSVTLEFLPAPSGLAWHALTLTDDPEAKSGTQGRRAAGGPAARANPAPAVRLVAQPPDPPDRAPGPSSDLGLIRTLRLLLNRPEEAARQVVAANPALTLALPDDPPRDFGEFTLAPRIVLREATTDSLGFCVEVTNRTVGRLIFDPASWVIRAGDRVYPVGTVDFSGEVDPGATALAFLVLGRGPNGEETRLLADSTFLPSVGLLGSAPTRAVRTFSLGEEDP